MRSDVFPEKFSDKLADAGVPLISRDLEERKLSGIRSDELVVKPIKGDFDGTHLAKIHHHLFQDSSSHAGVIRGYGMSKGESQFADASQIDYLLKKELPKRINALNKNVNDRTKYVAGMTDLHSTLDIAHPFREGNGRATRTFMTQLGKQHGYELDFSRIGKDRWVEACIDSLQSGKEVLKRPIFHKIVAPTRERMIESFVAKLTSLNKPTEEKSAIIKELQAEKVTKKEIEIARGNLISTSMNEAGKKIIKKSKDSGIER